MKTSQWIKFILTLFLTVIICSIISVDLSIIFDYNFIKKISIQRIFQLHIGTLFILLFYIAKSYYNIVFKEEKQHDCKCNHKSKSKYIKAIKEYHDFDSKPLNKQ